MKRQLLSAFALVGFAAAAVTTGAMAQDDAAPPAPEKAPFEQKAAERFDAMDADRDGKVTEAEIQAWHAARFAEADADKNGTLSAEELTAVQIARMQEMVAKRSAHMVEKLDGNGDGQLSAEELAQWAKPKTPFERADTDGDGAISKAEAQAAADHGKKGPKGGKGHGKHGHDPKDHDGHGWGDDPFGGPRGAWWGLN